MYHHFSPSENSSDVTRNFAYQKERCLRPSRFLNKPLYEEVEAHASTGAGRNYRSNASPFFFHVVASIGTNQGSLRHSACGARGKCTGLLLILRKIPSQIFKVKIYSGTDNFQSTLRQLERYMYTFVEFNENSCGARQIKPKLPRLLIARRVSRRPLTHHPR